MCELCVCERSLQEKNKKQNKQKKTGNDGTVERGRGGRDIVPNIPELPGDGSAQITEGS